MKNVDTIKILIVHYVVWLADTTLNNRISFISIWSWTSLIHFNLYISRIIRMNLKCWSVFKMTWILILIWQNSRYAFSVCPQLIPVTYYTNASYLVYFHLYVHLIYSRTLLEHLRQILAVFHFININKSSTSQKYRISKNQQ